MRYPFLSALLAPMLLAAPPPDVIDLPLREVANLQGVRGNMLLGYGLVVGLKGTGDTTLFFVPFEHQLLLMGFAILALDLPKRDGILVSSMARAENLATRCVDADRAGIGTAPQPGTLPGTPRRRPTINGEHPP